jgi:hypothetical protein
MKLLHDLSSKLAEILYSIVVCNLQPPAVASRRKELVKSPVMRELSGSHRVKAKNHAFLVEAF